MTGLHRLERSSTQPAVGRDVEAWCAKCGRAMEHTIVAMVGIEVVQVRCRTCGGTHKYKTLREAARSTSSEPRSSSRSTDEGESESRAEKASRSSSAAARTPKPKAEAPEARAARLIYARLMAQRDRSGATPYAISLEPTAGQLLEHKNFGYGIVDEVMTDKARILFEDGYRTLIIGRSV